MAGQSPSSGRLRKYLRKDRRQLLPFRGKGENANSVEGSFAKEFEYFLPGGRVDAAGRVVEHEHLGLNASHLARIAFCWLPPLSFPKRVSAAAGLTSKSSMIRSMNSDSRRGFNQKRARSGKRTFSATDRVGTPPDRRRSAGRTTIPALMRVPGLHAGERAFR